MPEKNRHQFFNYSEVIKPAHSASNEEKDKRKKLAILNKFKALCSKAIEEISENTQHSIPLYNEAGAIELEKLNPPQEKDELEKLLSEIKQLNESFYKKMHSYIESNDVKHIEGLKEITAELKEKFDSAKELALNSGFVKKENLLHKIINAINKIIIIKECICNSIINGDILKPSKEYKRILTNQINEAEATYYAGTPLDKVLKTLSFIVTQDQEAEKRVNGVRLN